MKQGSAINRCRSINFLGKFENALFRLAGSHSHFLRSKMQLEQPIEKGKSSAAKAADKRAAEAQKKWGMWAAGVFAITALLHLIVFQTELSFKGYLSEC